MNKALLVAKGVRAIYHTYGVEEGTTIIHQIVSEFVFPSNDESDELDHIVETDFGDVDVQG